MNFTITTLVLGVFGVSTTKAGMSVYMWFRLLLGTLIWHDFYLILILHSSMLADKREIPRTDRKASEARSRQDGLCRGR